MKPDSVGTPDIYLDAKLKKAQPESGVWCWTMSPSKYIQEAVRNTEKHINGNFDGKYSFKRNALNPFPLGYEAAIDTTPLLPPDEASYYNSVIGMLRWMVEIGRVDINTEVSELSSFLAMPRRCHMDVAMHVMSYLQHKHNSRLAFDPTYANIDYEKFNKKADWTSFYGEGKEALPPNAPKPLRKEVELYMFVDSDNAGDKATRRSRTGFMIFMNMALINWCSYPSQP